MPHIHPGNRECPMPLLIEYPIETSFNFILLSSTLFLSQISVLFSVLALVEANTKTDHYSSLDVFYAIDSYRCDLTISRAMTN